MTYIRDFLLSVLGGSETLWDVALGVAIGGVVAGALIGLAYLVLSMWAYSISPPTSNSSSSLDDVTEALQSIDSSLLDIKHDIARRTDVARDDY